MTITSIMLNFLENTVFVYYRQPYHGFKYLKIYMVYFRKFSFSSSLKQVVLIFYITLKNKSGAN